MAGYLKLKNPIQNNKLKEKLLSQKFTGMLKELAPIKHSINKSRDALISCINDTIKSKNCPVFSELPVKESKTKESKAVKATDTVNVKTAVTKKTIQEKEEASTDVKTDIIEKAESADAVKKGIEIYSVCGKEFTGNQSKMMIDVMKYIIENHFDMLDILEQKLTSVSKKAISELKKAGVNYFNTGSEFTYQGQIYSVGTSYDRSAKMSQIRNAIMLTGENPSDFIVDGLFNEQQLEKAMLCYNNVNNSDSSEEVAAIARKQGDEVYKIGNQEFTGNQSKMMTDVMKYIIEKHFDMFDLLAQNLTSVGDGSIDELKKDFTYFNTGRQFSYNGKIYSVGTAYDRSTKMRQIRNAIMLTGENPSDFVIDGLFNEQQLEKAMLCYNNVNSSDSSEEVAAIARKQGDEVYRIGNQEFTGNQSKMMTDAMKYIIEKHFDMLDILEQKLTSVSKKPISELKKAGVNYFNSGSEFTYQGQIYSVGTSYGRNEKLAQIRNAIMLTGEEPQKFDINGLFNEKQFEEAEMRYYELFSEMAEE
jgi:regulator of sigma D